MANGGAALGRDSDDHVIFVPFGIPGEVVNVSVPETNKRFTWGELTEVVDRSAERVDPRCPHFGVCGGCHFQHIEYEAQLRYKREVLIDQLERIGGLKQVVVKPTLANPEPWGYSAEVDFYPTHEGRLGFWSRQLSDVIPIVTCPISRPDLINVFQDINLEMTGLRRLTLRQGSDDLMLALIETENAEPPALETDIPISAALKIFGDKVVNLIGENYLVYSIKGRHFRVSAASFFYPSPAASEVLVDTILKYASLEPTGTIHELYSGVGLLTSFLADIADEVFAVEGYEDSVADTIVNLASVNNVSLYEGFTEEILPHIETKPDLVVADPPASGLPVSVIDSLVQHAPDRLLYISSDSATLARDSKRLSRAGFQIIEIQPIDMYPQKFDTLSISYWKFKS